MPMPPSYAMLSGFTWKSNDIKIRQSLDKKFFQLAGSAQAEKTSATSETTYSFDGKYPDGIDMSGFALPGSYAPYPTKATGGGTITFNKSGFSYQMVMEKLGLIEVCPAIIAIQ